MQSIAQPQAGQRLRFSMRKRSAAQCWHVEQDAHVVVDHAGVDSAQTFAVISTAMQPSGERSEAGE